MYSIIYLHLVLGGNYFLEIGEETASPASKICTGYDIIFGVGKFKIYTPLELFKF